MGDSWERLLPVGSQPKLSLLTLGSFHCHPTNHQRVVWALCTFWFPGIPLLDPVRLDSHLRIG